MKELICITCPKGCRLMIDDTGNISVGSEGCPRGIEYAKKEMTNPTRVITSTVRIEGAAIDRLPVKTDKDIPKGCIPASMELLDKVTVRAPVSTGDVIVHDILGTGANWVATRTLKQSG